VSALRTRLRKQVLTVLAVLPPTGGEHGDDPGPTAA